MAQEIVIPTVGESVTEGVIAAWTKADGEWVERDETVLELETDKVTMELPSPAAGKLSHSAAEGDTVEVGAVVGSIDESAEKPAGGSANSGASGSSASASADGGGTAVKDPPATKTDTQNTPPASNGAAAPAPAPAPAPNSEPESNGDVHATPLARKLASENRVDLHGLTGTGPGGRVREQDVLAAMRNGSPGSASAGAAAPAAGSNRPDGIPDVNLRSGSSFCMPMMES